MTNGDGNVTFLPNPLPPTLNYDQELTNLVAEAHAKLGELSGVGQLLPNPHLLILPYLRREAVLSSMIEGTQASLSDLFLFEVTGEESEELVRKRVREVNNYVIALETTWRTVKRGKPISLKLLKSAHQRLLAGVRGQQAEPGSFRTIQNWIGATRRIEDAVYVPPAPQYIEEALRSLEEFIKNPPPDIPLLIQCALIHYQFEAIHPFIDGNGRIGRLLIPLYLCEKHGLSQPLLYLSEFLEGNRAEYYTALRSASQTSEWNGWIRFFLRGVSEHATEAVKNVQKLLRLRNAYDKRLRNVNASKNVILLVEYLFRNPYTTAKNASEYLRVSFKTAQKAIAFLVKLGILTETTSRKRNRVYVATQINHVLGGR